MGKIYIIISAFLFVNSCYAQSLHKDLMEYGYKGKVKVIVKKNYPNPVASNNIFIPSDSNSVTTYTYFFNEYGNIDSTFTDRSLSSGETYFYKTIYNFEKTKKTGWTAYNINGERILSGKIIWQSDIEYTEKVYDQDDNLKFETKTIMNDFFRITKTDIKAFDITGKLIQNDVQEFQLDKAQNTELYKTIHQKDGSIDTTEYQYLSSDKIGNPTKLVISKKNRDSKTLVTMDYVYYH